MPKYVYLFSEVDAAETSVGGDWDAARGLLGGKGANLGDLTRLGVPVPPGFTATTVACNDYLAAGNSMPDGLWDQELEAIAALEAATGREFGGTDNPLLVSCRSGAKFSMPGMMDTILNLGLTEEIVNALAARTGQDRFAWDLYRRLVHMFGSVAMDIPDELFEEVITAQRLASGAATDTDLDAADWQVVTKKFKDIFLAHTGETFPDDPREQLRRATEAVFRSWNGKRAFAYRNAAGISHDLGTAVNIQTMVFGNLGDTSATGVCMSRNATNGEPHLEGDYLVNAQGEDVVAGTRATLPIDDLATKMPALHAELEEISKRLEGHYRNMQDMEFTIEEGKLWMLQTRDGKRTAQAEVRIAVDLVKEGLIDSREAVRRVQPDQVDFFLHPQLDAEVLATTEPLAHGLNVSPGAAVGMVAFDPDIAERWAKDEGKKVILARPETRPDDVHGMLAAEGVLTCKGGRTSHAALVARQFGKPAVVGVAELEIDVENGQMTIGDLVIREGDMISLDGTTGNVYLGALATVVPDMSNPYLLQILEWADEIRVLGVHANADYPEDARRAREYGAEGIGLCRTEHMFFQAERLPIVQQMITATNDEDRDTAIDKLMPMQQADFEGLFRAMDGLPVIVRLLDPPLHEFLPTHADLNHEIRALEDRLASPDNREEAGRAEADLQAKRAMLERVEALHESNPMLGTRGVRLGILIPNLYRMQVKAAFEAACRCAADGLDPRPEIMIPLVSHANELHPMVQDLRADAEAVMAKHGVSFHYLFGTMIEIPRACLTAGDVAQVAEFFSFGTNDLTQTTFGISRDDAEAGFLVHYMQEGVLEQNPFATIDPNGVGQLMRMAVREGRAARPGLEIGVCGEHGGDPDSIRQCHDMGLNYVSCSPFRVPVARLAAAHAALESTAKEASA